MAVRLAQVNGQRLKPQLGAEQHHPAERIRGVPAEVDGVHGIDRWTKIAVIE
jgi:hypothetical protein